MPCVRSHDRHSDAPRIKYVRQYLTFLLLVALVAVVWNTMSQTYAADVPYLTTGPKSDQRLQRAASERLVSRAQAASLRGPDCVVDQVLVPGSGSRWLCGVLRHLAANGSTPCAFAGCDAPPSYASAVAVRARAAARGAPPSCAMLVTVIREPVAWAVRLAQRFGRIVPPPPSLGGRFSYYTSAGELARNESVGAWLARSPRYSSFVLNQLHPDPDGAAAARAGATGSAHRMADALIPDVKEAQNGIIAALIEAVGTPGGAAELDLKEVGLRAARAPHPPVLARACVPARSRFVRDLLTSVWFLSLCAPHPSVLARACMWAPPWMLRGGGRHSR